MAIQIPLFKEQSSNFTQNIDLENVNIEIKLVYNTRTETWVAKFTTTNYAINGIKLTKNFPLLWKYRASFPEIIGDFIVLKISDDINVNVLDYDTLGVYYALFYITQEELEQWKISNGIQ